MDALLGKRDHFRFLTVVGAGEKIPASGVRYFLVRIGRLRITDVVHKVADLPRLGLVGFVALNFLNDHVALP